jgi:hypothetical protein
MKHVTPDLARWQCTSVGACDILGLGIFDDVQLPIPREVERDSNHITVDANDGARNVCTIPLLDSAINV